MCIVRKMIVAASLETLEHMTVDSISLYNDLDRGISLV